MNGSAETDVPHSQIDPDPWQWWYRTVLYWVLTCDLVIGITLCTSHTKFFNTPALQLIRLHTFPWPVWGGLWIFAGLLLVLNRWVRFARIAGYFLGGVMAEWFSLFALGYNLFAAHIGNVILSLLATQAGLLYFAGIRYQLIIITRPGVAASIASRIERG